MILISSSNPRPHELQCLALYNSLPEQFTLLRLSRHCLWCVGTCRQLLRSLSIVFVFAGGVSLQRLFPLVSFPQGTLTSTGLSPFLQDPVHCAALSPQLVPPFEAASTVNHSSWREFLWCFSSGVPLVAQVISVAESPSSFSFSSHAT